MAKTTSAAKSKTAVSKKTVSKKTPQKANEKVPPKEENILQPSFKKHCSYCGKPSTDAPVLIAGPPPLYPFICNECVEVCVKILMETDQKYWRPRFINILATIKQKDEIPLDKEKTKTKGKKMTPRRKQAPQMGNN